MVMIFWQHNGLINGDWQATVSTSEHYGAQNQFAQTMPRPAEAV
jgi:hypothetical protein